MRWSERQTLMVMARSIMKNSSQWWPQSDLSRAAVRRTFWLWKFGNRLYSLDTLQFLNTYSFLWLILLQILWKPTFWWHSFYQKFINIFPKHPVLLSLPQYWAIILHFPLSVYMWCHLLSIFSSLHRLTNTVTTIKVVFSILGSDNLFGCHCMKYLILTSWMAYK